MSSFGIRRSTGWAHASRFSLATRNAPRRKQTVWGPPTLALLGAVGLFLASGAFAQANPRGTSKLAANGKIISVEYGRPALHGRKIDDLIDQVKPGDVWRLGADQSTTFSTSGDLEFDGIPLPKGSYSLWALRDASGNWELRFNQQHGQWGTERDPGQDLIAVLLDESRVSTHEERLTITLSEEGGGLLSIQWGDVLLSAEFEVK